MLPCNSNFFPFQLNVRVCGLQWWFPSCPQKPGAKESREVPFGEAPCLLNPLSGNLYKNASSLKARTSVTFTDVAPRVKQGLGYGEVLRKRFLYDQWKERTSVVFTRAGYCSSCPFQQPTGGVTTVILTFR